MSSSRVVDTHWLFVQNVYKCVHLQNTPAIIIIIQGWAQGSFVEAEAEVEAEARQGSNVLNRGEARQRQRQRARGRGEAD